MNRFSLQKPSVFFLAAVLCGALFAGCARSAADPEGSDSSAGIHLEEMSAGQLEDLESFLYDWYFFCPDPVSSPDEIPRDARMLHFVCQQTWVKKLAAGESLELVGDTDWQIVLLAEAEVEQMYTDLFGDSENFSLLPITALPCAVEDLGIQLKSLDWGTGAYYLADKEAFLVSAVYGQDLSALEPAELSVSGEVLTGVIRGKNTERRYSFAWNEEQLPCLTLISIQ